MINFPPWLQTLLTSLLGVSLAAPVVVRLFGWETSDLGARVIHASNDVQKALGKNP